MNCILLIIKCITIIAIFIPNWTIFIKIITKPKIHSISNMSVASLLGLVGLFGPFLSYFYFELTVNHYLDAYLNNVTRQYSDCARLIELRNVIGESLKFIGIDLMFRSFFIVHAEKGLIFEKHSKLLKVVFLICTLSWTVAGYLSWPGSVMLSSDYPSNTVKVSLFNSTITSFAI